MGDVGIRYFASFRDTGEPTILVRVTDAVRADRLLPGTRSWERYDNLLRLVYQDPDMSYDEVDLATAADVARRLGAPPGILGMAATPA